MPGMVLAIGGAESHEGDPAVLRTFLNLTGRDPVIAVIAGASLDAAHTYGRYADTFRRLGARQVHWADDPDGSGPVADWWPEITGIFFSGGDQARLVAGISPLLPRILACWAGGAPVAGSSAGAAALSRVMLAGGSARSPLDPAGLQFAEGLGFWPDAIVDQHFSERRRLPRLLTAVIAHPDRVGVGLDENTAACWYPESQELEVLGSGTVTVVDARGAGARSGRSPIVVHVLTAGERLGLHMGEAAS